MTTEAQGRLGAFVHQLTPTKTLPNDTAVEFNRLLDAVVREAQAAGDPALREALAHCVDVFEHFAEVAPNGMGPRMTMLRFVMADAKDLLAAHQPAAGDPALREALEDALAESAGLYHAESRHWSRDYGQPGIESFRDCPDDACRSAAEALAAAPQPAAALCGYTDKTGGPCILPNGHYDHSDVVQPAAAPRETALDVEPGTPMTEAGREFAYGSMADAIRRFGYGRHTTLAYILAIEAEARGLAVAPAAASAELADERRGRRGIRESAERLAEVDDNLARRAAESLS